MAARQKYTAHVLTKNRAVPCMFTCFSSVLFIVSYFLSIFNVFQLEIPLSEHLL